jgi:hypothetical protein
MAAATSLDAPEGKRQQQQQQQQQPPAPQTVRPVPLCVDLMLSAAAGGAARSITHPLDTLKTIAIVFPKNDPRGGVDGTLRRAWNVAMTEGGVRGLYRGIGVAVLGAAPGIALYMSSYNFTKHTLSRDFGFREDSALVHLASGFCAEAASCVVWVPIDVIKERMQAQTTRVRHPYRSTFEAIEVCRRHEGLRGLYRGYFTTLGSFGPFSAIYFCIFEALQKRWKAQLDASSGGLLANPVLQYAVCGALANATACVATNPVEVVKVRMQVQRARNTWVPDPSATVAGEAATTVSSHPVKNRSSNGGIGAASPLSHHYRGFVDGARAVMREEGLFAFWRRGLMARICFTAPNAALTFGFYKLLKDKYFPGYN